MRGVFNAGNAERRRTAEAATRGSFSAYLCSSAVSALTFFPLRPLPPLSYLFPEGRARAYHRDVNTRQTHSSRSIWLSPESHFSWL